MTASKPACHANSPYDMRTILTRILLSLLLLCAFSVQAQRDREPENDPAILRRIAEWQDLKFGFMVHWGMYAQWGVVESWSICNEPWIVREQLGPDGPVAGTRGADYYDYKCRYQSLNRTFNPRHFDPSAWTAAARQAGMRYMVFTTKHHDGFCMFRSAETDYSVAGADCPYSRNAQPDITRAIVDACRVEGLWTGLYFSKPDWHHPDYWAPEWATPDRNVNYDIVSHPDRWDRFRRFTYAQVRELTHNYGDIDILWLDGGWVRPAWSVNEETRPWLGCSGQVQDIGMDSLVAIARDGNPDLIVVDRSVGGRYENYRTPEQQVPDMLLPYSWETCMTMGESWSYSPRDRYKSTTRLIHLLADVVAKGGNLLLNVGPDAEGRLPDTALLRMREIGEWLSVNRNAIYATRPLYPYSRDNVRYTQSKDGRFRYAVCLLDSPATAVTVTIPFAVKRPVPLAPKQKVRVTSRKSDSTTLTVTSTVPMRHAVVVAF